MLGSHGYLSPFIFQLFDTSKEKKRMGYVTVPLKSILNAPDMTVHRPYPVKETTPATKLVLRMCMRVSLHSR